ncbi:MAG: hypothetical protein KGZ85_18125 [Ignavibacterium sp.]|nr:hypothetical protein [Ignavibacterium sp.]
MKKYISPIKGIKNPIWWEQKGPAIPFLTYGPSYASTITLSKNYPIALKYLVCFVENGEFSYSYEEKDMKKIGDFIFNKTYQDQNFLGQIIKKWRYFLNRYYKFCRKLDEVDFKKIDNNQFKELFEKFCNFYYDAYSFGLLADPFAAYADEKFPKYLNQIVKEEDKGKIYEYFSKLTESEKKTFFIEEKEGLLKIFLYVQNNKSSINYKNFDFFLKKDKHFIKLINNHVKKYHWLLNNYARVKKISANFFIKEIKQLIKKGDNPRKLIKEIKERFEILNKRKQELIKRLGGDKKLKIFVLMMESFSCMQDQRKKSNLLANHYLIIFLRELSRRTKISYDDLVYIYPPELSEILRTKKIDKNILKQRKKCVVFYSLNKKTGILNGEQAKRLKREMKLDFKSLEAVIVKGIPASSGNVRRRVRILRFPEEISMMKNGEVLITSMTRPEFMAGIKKAGAIITDEGGMTCHAAIVSREMGIPCIIGTKIATKVFKTGDLIEVDADKGIIRKIK